MAAAAGPVNSSSCVATTIALVDLLDIAKHVFEVPQEQRPYSWDKWIVGDLLSDIERALDRNDEYYLLGSIVLMQEADSKCYDVIDGQQRLTTLVALYVVLRGRMLEVSKKLATSERSEQEQRLRDELLTRMSNR